MVPLTSSCNWLLVQAGRFPETRRRAGQPTRGIMIKGPVISNWQNYESWLAQSAAPPPDHSSTGLPTEGLTRLGISQLEEAHALERNWDEAVIKIVSSFRAAE